MSALITAAAGFLAGIAASMGLGGGFVLILYLTWAGMEQIRAQAANLLFFIPAALISIIMNRNNGMIDFNALPYAAAAGSIGAVVGLVISGSVDSSDLRKLFAVLLITVGLRELFHRVAPEKSLRPRSRSA